MSEIACLVCGQDRVRRWEAMRRVNGLTEEEWPAPGPPLFRSRIELAIHQFKKHRKDRTDGSRDH